MKMLDNWHRQEEIMKYSNATFSVGGKCCAGCDQRDVWLKQAKTRTEELENALELFCQRVDAGEVRSIKTYAMFKELLNK